MSEPPEPPSKPLPRSLVVLENPARFKLKVPGVEVVGAREYLTDSAFGEARRTRVLNLCRATGYQGWGYYVSLLAMARGHRPLPSLATLQDLTQDIVERLVTRELERLIERSFRRLRSSSFELSVYFGHNLAHRYEPLAKALFARFPTPLLRAAFERGARGWRLIRVRTLDLSEVPNSHMPFLAEQAQLFLAGKTARRRDARNTRFDMAILVDPEEDHPPSDSRALKRFEKAAAEVGIHAVQITKDDVARIAEFDALFIRATTAVDHFTYRVARRAQREDLVVVDDPESILRCTNKVFMAEAFTRAKVPQPPTLVVHEGNRDQVAAQLGFPCVLKRPDSSFSQGVVKVDGPEELEVALDRLLEDSRLVVAQGFVRSEFDWRVGVLGGEPLYLCRYHLVKGHWTIQSTGPRGGTQYGNADCVPLDEAPRGLLQTAVKATRPIGTGLYGVDLKETSSGFVVMEVNDNPSLDSGVEDRLLGEELYRRIIGYFLGQLEIQMKRGSGKEIRR